MAVALAMQDLISFAADCNVRLFATTEVDPVDPDVAYMITIMPTNSEWSARFMGRTMLGAITGAIDYIKHITSGPIPQSQQPQE